MARAQSAAMTASDDDITALDATALSEAIHARRVSCREVMQAYLARIARLNPTYNAIVSLRPDDALLAEADACDAQLARGASRGWLHGVPQAIKDLANGTGLPTTLGSPLMRDFIAHEDGLMPARMKGAGCTVIGKTNVPEFGLGSTPSTKSSAPPSTPTTSPNPPPDRAAARPWRWRSACCQWPTART